MNIYTSYFYKVRFLRPDQLAFSTAVWDPKWFHDFRSPDYVFVDKRGVINGLRAPMFAPIAHSCKGPEHCTYSPSDCPFTNSYRQQLDALDFEDVMEYFRKVTEVVGYTDPDIVLLVYERPTNPCSERIPIQQWFASHGVTVKELS